MSKTIDKLNVYLAELNVFYRKLQNFHWYIKGHDFPEVHAQLESYYDTINGEIDEVAELILQLGGKPLASFKDYLATAKIKEEANEFRKSDYILPSVLADFRYLLTIAKDIKATADEEGCTASSAYADGSIANYLKTIWFLSSTIEA